MGEVVRRVHPEVQRGHIKIEVDVATRAERVSRAQAEAVADGLIAEGLPGVQKVLGPDAPDEYQVRWRSRAADGEALVRRARAERYTRRSG